MEGGADTMGGGGGWEPGTREHIYIYILFVVYVTWGLNGDNYILPLYQTGSWAWGFRVELLKSGGWVP